MTGPHTPPGAVANTHHPSAGPLNREQIDWLRDRPAQARRPLPAVGDVVGFRESENGPVVTATVLRWVDDLEDPYHNPAGQDPNVWKVVTDPSRAVPLYDALGRRRFELVADPWPALELQVEPTVREVPGGGTEVKGRRRIYSTREARLAGAVGWLPAEMIDPMEEG